MNAGHCTSTSDISHFLHSRNIISPVIFDFKFVYRGFINHYKLIDGCLLNYIRLHGLSGKSFKKNTLERFPVHSRLVNKKCIGTIRK